MPAAAAKSRTIRSCVRIAFAGLRSEVADRQAQQLGVARDRLGLPRRALAGRRGVRREVVHHRHHDHAGGAVDRGVVVLREQRPAAVLEALDDVDLPQRAGAVHRPADDAGDLLGELVAAAGRRQAHVADVEVEVEVRVHHPVRVVEAHRHLDDAAAHRLELTDLRRVAAVHRRVRIEVVVRPLVDRQAVDVAERRRRLHVQEAAVQAGELLHPNPPCALRCVGPRSQCRGNRGAVLTDEARRTAVRETRRRP